VEEAGKAGIILDKYLREIDAALGHPSTDADGNPIRTPLTAAEQKTLELKLQIKKEI
jgi:hypothetical protein